MCAFLYFLNFIHSHRSSRKLLADYISRGSKVCYLNSDPSFGCYSESNSELQLLGTYWQNFTLLLIHVHIKKSLIIIRQ